MVQLGSLKPDLFAFNFIMLAIISSLFSYHQQLLAQGHRQLVLLQGNAHWQQQVIEQYQAYYQQHNQSNAQFWLFAETKDTRQLNTKNFRQWLGQECDGLIYQHNSVHLEPLIALTGSVKAGGFLFVCLPESLSVLADTQQLLWQRLLTFAKQYQGLWLDEKTSEIDVTQSPIPIISNNPELLYQCITQEQQQAVEQILSVATGHRNRPLVLTADRGRGKTTALALACIELVKQKQQAVNIIITAPSKRAVQGFFSTVEQAFNAKWHNNHISYQQHNIHFMAVDQIVHELPPCQLLLVDEAASIPLYLLSQLLQNYHRLVFSTTVHGYEGAGRGFTLKFIPELLAQFPQTKQLHIGEAIRWQANDPVELWSFATGALNAQLPELLPEPVTSDFVEITQQQLNQDETLLQQVFAILVSAHYQTSPNDLVLLLTHSKIKIFALKTRAKILAVALIMVEGANRQLDAATIEQVYLGKRRIKDHFLPQALAVQQQWQAAFDYQYFRVMRIAVHPAIQQQQFGSKLLAAITEQAKHLHVDWLGASFALNQPVLNFWLKNQFALVNLGLKQDHASGEFSSIVLKPLNAKASTQVIPLQQQFYRQINYRLARYYKSLSLELVATIARALPKAIIPELTSKQLTQLKQLAQHRLVLDYHAPDISHWLWFLCEKPFCNKLLLAIAKFWLDHDNANLCSRFELSGKAEIEQQLYQFFAEQFTEGA